MGKKIKLLIVMAAMERGGAERSLINLMEMLDYDRYAVDLLVFQGGGQLMSQIPKQVNLLQPDRRLRFLSSSKTSELLKNFSLKAFLARVCYGRRKRHNVSPYLRSQDKWKYAYQSVLPHLKENYDTAIAYMHSLPSYYVIDKVQAKRKLLWVHNDYSRLIEGKDFDRMYFEKADQVVTISEQCVRELEKAFPELKEKIVCIYNLNPESKIREKAEEFYPEEYKSCAGLKLLSIGRLNYQKGFDYAVAAAGLMKEQEISFHWYIIGVGDLKQALEEQIQEAGLIQQVHLLGGRENPYPYIKYADMVIQTSRYEGKSIVLDEAKILNKPIITTDYISVHDQIEHEKTGMIVPLTARSIAKAIAALSADERMRTSLIEYLQALPDITQQELQRYYAYFDGQ